VNVPGRLPHFSGKGSRTPYTIRNPGVWRFAFQGRTDHRILYCRTALSAKTSSVVVQAPCHGQCLASFRSSRPSGQTTAKSHGRNHDDRHMQSAGAIWYLHLPEPPTMLSTILLTVVVLFPASEIALARFKRARPQISRLEDRGSLRLMWLAITIGVSLAVAASWLTFCSGSGSLWLLRSLALSLMVAGLALRWVAILSLGRFFTVDVAIQADQSVVESGPYRFVRHPSYSGLLLAFVGLGLFFQNWLSILVLVVPLRWRYSIALPKKNRHCWPRWGVPMPPTPLAQNAFIPHLL